MMKSIKVPFMQFAGVNGQMLIEDLVNGFYIVFPGQKFQLPTKLAQIEKLKSTIKITKYVMVRSIIFFFFFSSEAYMSN